MRGVTAACHRHARKSEPEWIYYERNGACTPWKKVAVPRYFALSQHLSSYRFFGNSSGFFHFPLSVTKTTEFVSWAATSKKTISDTRPCLWKPMHALQESLLKRRFRGYIYTMYVYEYLNSPKYMRLGVQVRFIWLIPYPTCCAEPVVLIISVQTRKRRQREWETCVDQN